MVVKIELTREGRAQLRNLAIRADPSFVATGIVGFFDRAGARIAASISASIARGGVLERRTGNLARSIVGFGSVELGRPGVEVGVVQGPALAYALVLEVGTQSKNPESPIPDIRPKKAKALAIPVGAALTPAGVPRYTGPREYPGELHYAPVAPGSKSVGRLVDEQGETLFLLVGSVAIAPRRYLEGGLTKALPGLVVDLEAFMAGLLDAPGGGVQA